MLKAMNLKDFRTAILGLMDYDETGEIQKTTFENPLAEAAYISMLETTQNNHDGYLEKCAKNAVNSKKGGAPKGNQNAKKQPKTTQNNPDRIGKDRIGEDRIGQECECDIESPTDSEAHTQARTPSLAEVREFCDAEGLSSINPERFWQYYESVLWRIDGQPMDWKARARLWNTQDAESKQKKKPFDDFSQRDYDWEEEERRMLEETKQVHGLEA